MAMFGNSMSKASVNLKNLRKNSRGIYWFMLIVLLALEVMVVKKSVDIVMNSQKVASQKITGGVRINFTDYQAIVQRMQRAEDYKPQSPVQQNPFNTPANPINIIQ